MDAAHLVQLHLKARPTLGERAALGAGGHGVGVVPQRDAVVAVGEGHHALASLLKDQPAAGSGAPPPSPQCVEKRGAVIHASALRGAQATPHGAGEAPLIRGRLLAQLCEPSLIGLACIQ